MTAPPENDTIAAIATPAGRGGIGVVRVSGPAARELAIAVLGGLPTARHAQLSEFRDDAGAVLDQGIALFFPAPNSFTGEDVLEMHGHGGPVVLDLLLRRLLSLGARLARAGEFSERAFLNGKLDLLQAEAVADLIDSSSETAARSAMRSLQGAFSRTIHELVNQLTRLRTRVEADIDFSDEDIDAAGRTELTQSLDDLDARFEDVLASARQGRLLREGIHIVIAGRPNAGKSSLLNALSGQDSAIVSETPGTTRDVIREHIHIDGMPVHVLDTAGLRDTDEDVESEGVRRARAAMGDADRILLVVDDSDPVDEEEIVELLSELPEGVARTIVRNKIDLRDGSPQRIDTRCYKEVTLSARTGAGLELLREHLRDQAGFHGDNAGGFLARRRHLDAIDRARAHAAAARSQLTQPDRPELAAEELRLAQQALGEITGEVSSDDLLGHIFAEFCIGK
jgi:tRNA modification GTPase